MSKLVQAIFCVIGVIFGSLVTHKGVSFGAGWFFALMSLLFFWAVAKERETPSV